MVVNMPTGIAAGDLLMIFAAFDGSQTPTIGVGNWVVIDANLGTSSAVTQRIWAKIAEGGDTATIEASAQDGVCIAVRITGHGVSSVANDITIGTPSLSTTPSVFMPACTPGVADDFLWLETFSADDDDDYIGEGSDGFWSTDFTGVRQEQSASTASSCMVALAYRELNAATLSPGIMRMAAFEESVSQTLAIPPAVILSETDDALDIDDAVFVGVDIPQRGRAPAWIRKRRG